LQQPLRAIAVLVLTSTIVQLGLLPLSASYFNRIALIGIALNIVADLLMTLLLGAFLLFIAVDACSPSGGQQAARLLEVVSNLFIRSASPLPGLSKLSFRVANYTGWQAGIYVFYFVPILFFMVWVDRWQPLQMPTVTRPKMRWKRWVSAGLCL